VRRAGSLGIIASFVTALLSAWLLASVVPAVRGEAQQARTHDAQRQALSDAVASHALARAVFTRDYGEAQELLDRYAEIGYATRAVVTNNDRIVVASVGALSGLQIGGRLPDVLATGGRAVRLALRSEIYGELRIVAPSASALATDDPRWAGTLRTIAIALLVASIATLASLVIVRMRRD